MVKGHYLYIGGPNSGLQVFDVRDPDLRDWEDWVVLPLGAQPTEIGDPEAGPRPYRFYRVVEK